MTAINPETEIVATRHDAVAHTNYYTIERGGKRWTIKVSDDEFARLKAAPGQMRAARRNHMAKMLTQAMQGPHD